MYSITIRFNYPSQIEEITMTTRSYFTKEELIERLDLNKELIAEVTIHEKKEEVQDEQEY
jgi:hypothetical protein